MSEPEKSPRSWRQIAQEASQERDSKRLAELTQELERALDEVEQNPSASTPVKRAQKSA
jgi:hypothetical protein